MGRKPGSKNKPKEQETVIESQEPKKKRHRRTKAEMEAYRASLAQQEQKQEQQLQVEVENESEIEIENEPELDPNDFQELSQSSKEDENSSSSTGQVDTSVGVEESPQEFSKTLLKNQETEKITSKPKKIKQQKSVYLLCDCCQQEIYCQPHRIDTNILTAQVAEYHRESPRWVNLCTKCALQLSETVDSWLRENGCITRMEQRMKERENNE